MAERDDEHKDRGGDEQFKAFVGGGAQQERRNWGSEKLMFLSCLRVCVHRANLVYEGHRPTPGI